MIRIQTSLVLATLSFALLPLAAHAERRQSGFVVAALYDGCNPDSFGGFAGSSCIDVPKAGDGLAHSKQGGINGWSYIDKKSESKIWPKSDTQTRLPPAKPKKVIVADVCRKPGNNCKFVSAESEQGKQLLGNMRRNGRMVTGNVSSIITGLYVPPGINIIVSPVVCTLVAVGHDGTEYIEDNHAFPTFEQYAKSYGYNLGYCSGISQIFDAPTFPGKLLAFGRVILPFLKVPAAVTNLNQAASYAQTIVNSNAPANKKVTPVHHAPKTQ